MLLISTVGTGDYRHVVYFRADRPEQTWPTRFAPVATTRLYGISRVLLLLTADARRLHGSAVTQELENCGASVEIAEIPLGGHVEESWQVVEQVLAHLDRAGSGADVALDITHALRHLPVLLLAAVTFASGRGGVQVRHVLYGALEVQTPAGVPVFDLAAFVQLVAYYHAARQFRETGDARRVTAQLLDLKEGLFRGGQRAPHLAQLADELERLSRALMAGLPLEAGLYASAAQDRYREAGLQELHRYRPTAARLFGLIEQTLAEVAMPALPAPPKKALLRLDLAELERQLRVAQLYCDQGNLNLASLVLREWIVSRCLLAAGQSRWLDYATARRPMELALNGLAERVRSGSEGTTAEQRELAACWQSIRDFRNELAHAGMCEQEVNSLAGKKPPAGQELARWLGWCNANIARDVCWQPGPTSQDHLLVTAFGLSPGILLTALSSPRLADVNRVLVITSADARPRLPEACQKAGYALEQIEVEQVQDPFRCFDEAGPILERWRGRLATLGKVTINVTGGTSAMQYLVERIGREAERLGVPLRRIALIDPRPPEVQRAEPYVVGEAVELESGPGSE